MSLNVLDLFSGIGGFSLGLERAGMRTVAFCEIEPYCRAVLRKHWPGVPIFEDVRTLTGADVPGVDVICGGFPCQDISTAGNGAGLKGERSGLWSEYARLVGEIRPRYVIVENVAALLGRGLQRVLGDLAALGFDAEWHCIPASAVGAPHQRDRVWIVAYPAMHGSHDEASGTSAGIDRQNALTRLGLVRSNLRCSGNASPNVAWNGSTWRDNGGRTAKPILVGMADGIPNRMDRITALGNAVVPQIPEIIGRAIVEGLRR